ncbi:MAG: hypothetical protein MUP11_01500 [Anaerolineales bacterium]|nr:hypothetical protein [Anaerolineales bacterium]
MKKIFLILMLVFLVGCGSSPEADTSSSEIEDLESQIADKDRKITDLEYQVEDLTVTLNKLQEAVNLAQSDTVASEAQTASFMCPDPIDNMKYQNPSTAIAVLEGWFALQPQVREIQGTYSTQFWSDVNS